MRRLLVAVAVVIGACSPATAQEEAALEIRGAYSIPFGDLAADGVTDDGLGFGVGVRVLLEEWIAAYLAADRSTFRIDPPPEIASDGETVIRAIAAGAQLYPAARVSGRVQPFLFGGPTLNLLETRLRIAGQEVRGSDRWRVGAEAGAGARIRITDRGALVPGARLRWNPGRPEGDSATSVTYAALELGVSLAVR